MANDEAALRFLRDEHVQFTLDQSSNRSYEYWLSEHLRLNGTYWGITALVTMRELDKLPREEVLSFVMSCYDEKLGGFGAFPKHDAHILSTLSALQIIRIYDDSMEVVKHIRSRLLTYIKSLQLSDGSFQGDRFGEVDTRFIYTSLSSLALLGELTPEIVDPAVDYIMKCQNFDGAFGMVPGSESHAAQVFVCVGALAIVDKLHLIPNETKLSGWLSERQVLPSGGFNGRPEKLPDVCYSWWVLSSLAILEKKHWVDLTKLEDYILSCQDAKAGGISDRPDNQTDIFHTCFGITGLSLIDHKKFDLEPIDPVFCMPVKVTRNFIKWKN